MSPPTAPMNSPRTLSRVPTAAAAMVLVGAALAAYANTFGVPFLFDDARAIPDNPSIRHLWPLWNAFWPRSSDMAVSGRPVAHLTLAVNYALSGNRVWSYHALNLLIHVLGGLALFGVVRRTLQRPVLQARFGRDARWLALAIALLWTLHPLQTEAVTYVIQRVESLMGLFYLLTVYCFIRAVESPQPRRWQLGAIGVCLLGMATKEVMATAPVLVLLYDRTFAAGTFREAWRRRRWLHLGLAATWLPLAVMVASTGWNRGGTAGINVGVAPWAYWLTQFEAVTRYLGLAVWPHPLVFEFGTFWVRHPGELAPYVLIVVPLVAATGQALWRRPMIGFLGAWFFVILAPTSVVPGIIQMIVEHRMYLPLAAVITPAVLGLYAAVGRRSWVVLAALALGLGVLTARRNYDYRSELALWSDTVARRPANTRARNGLALALDHAGRLPEAIRQFEEALRLAPGDVEIRDNLGVTLEHAGRTADAIRHYQAALALKPNFPEAHNNLGNALARFKRYPEAIQQYEEALRLRPDYAETRYNLGGALDLAERTDEAIQQYEAALRLKPDYAEAHNNFGNLLHRIGRDAEAVQQYEAALRLEPGLARAHHNLGLVFEKTGQIPAAMQQYEAALRLQPDLAEAQNNLGVLLCRGGRVAEGLVHLHEAVRLGPDVARSHFNLGVALMQAGRTPEAIQQYQEALRLKPDLAEVHNNLGMALGQSGRVPEAIAELNEALRLRPDNAEAHNNLGNALLATGQWDAAIVQYEEVLRLRPGDGPARQNLESARARRQAAGHE